MKKPMNILEHIELVRSLEKQKKPKVKRKKK